MRTLSPNYSFEDYILYILCTLNYTTIVQHTVCVKEKDFNFIVYRTFPFD